MGMSATDLDGDMHVIDICRREGAKFHEGSHPISRMVAT